MLNINDIAIQNDFLFNVGRIFVDESRLKTVSIMTPDGIVEIPKTGKNENAVFVSTVFIKVEGQLAFEWGGWFSHADYTLLRQRSDEYRQELLALIEEWEQANNSSQYIYGLDDYGVRTIAVVGNNTVIELIGTPNGAFRPITNALTCRLK